MKTKMGKTAGESRTEQVQIVLSEHLNGGGRLFGGKLVEWMDIVAGVVARRHCGRNVTTASIDSLQFRAAAHANELIILTGQLTGIGTTSMEVRVDAFVEDFSGIRRKINQAYLILVALDDDEKPTPVPPLIPETEEEKREQQAGFRRRQLREKRRLENF